MAALPITTWLQQLTKKRQRKTTTSTRHTTGDITKFTQCAYINTDYCYRYCFQIGMQHMAL